MPEHYVYPCKPKTKENRRIGKGDVFVFFKRNDKESFILIDLFHDFTDQHIMVKLGVRSSIENFGAIKDVIYSIYTRAEIKSKINESIDFLKSIP